MSKISLMAGCYIDLHSNKFQLLVSARISLSLLSIAVRALGVISMYDGFQITDSLGTDLTVMYGFMTKDYSRGTHVFVTSVPSGR